MHDMTSQHLPPAQQQRLDREFIENEQSYWQMREQLLAEYAGQWVAVDAGTVIASSDNLLDVTDQVGNSGSHAYIARVGQEDSLIFTIRRKTFAYNVTYTPFALPQAEVTFTNFRGTQRQHYSDVIPDTGADLSVLPEDDCATIDLYSSPYLVSRAQGVMGPSVTTLIYRGNAEIDGALYRCLIQPIPEGKERILGRDVLNQARVTFDGPQNTVVFE